MSVERTSPVSARATELADYIEQSTPPTYMEDVMLDRSDRELVITALRGHAPDQSLSVLIKQYALDLRRNASGGDDYPYEYAKAAADYLEELIKRAKGNCTCAQAGFPDSCDNCDGHAPTPSVPSIKDFVRAGISEFKEHELREIVATFCKLPGIAPQPAAQDATILSLVRVWRECPAERRPSAAALADRIIAALVDTSTLCPVKSQKWNPHQPCPVCGALGPWFENPLIGECVSDSSPAREGNDHV